MNLQERYLHATRPVVIRRGSRALSLKFAAQHNKNGSCFAGPTWPDTVKKQNLHVNLALP